MRAILLMVIPLMGAAVLASAGEQTDTAKTQKPITAPTANVDVATKAADETAGERAGERATLPEGIPLKVLRSTRQRAVSLLNPLAPMEPVPAAPWLKLAAWSTAADRAMPKTGAIETRHESRFMVVIW